ncbi:MAG: PilZ domain-containing protein [Oscillospiraceae bacterium]|nr:PilZ domain-containing protein [Oscillospiraceae bacterium]
MSKRIDRRVKIIPSHTDSAPQIRAVIRGKEQHHDVAVVDICRRGLRFYSEKEQKKGEVLNIELYISDADRSLALGIKAKILNDYGNHHYGVKFYRFLYLWEMSCIERFIYRKIRGAG